jgi:hypothetical protein
MAVDLKRLAHRCDDALRERGCLAGIGDRGLHDDEFVAAHPRDGVRLADQGAQALGDDLQQLVADGMTKGIVDGLELIEIEVVNRDQLLAMNALAQGLFEPLVQ